jgi:hypothetical protein
MADLLHADVRRLRADVRRVGDSSEHAGLRASASAGLADVRRPPPASMRSAFVLGSLLLAAVGQGQAWSPAARTFARASRLAHRSDDARELGAQHRSPDVRCADEPPPRGWLGGSAFERPPPPAAPERRAAPVGARARLSRTDAGTLRVEIPRAARGDIGSVAFGGAFSVAWFSAIGSFTAAALATASVGAVAFTLPFWLAGATVVKQTVLDPLLRHELEIGLYAFSARWVLPGGRVVKEFSGASEDLGEALPLLAEDGLVRALELRTRRGEVWTFGQGLSPPELNYLAQEIDAHCGELESQAAQFEMPALDQEA